MSEPLAFLTAALDAAQSAAEKAAALCGCHPPAPSWSFRDGDEPTDGRILVVDDPHPDVKRKIGRRWNGSYEGMFMAEHIARHDPATVLRRIAADRELIAQYEAAQRVLSTYAEPVSVSFAATEVVILGRVLRLLAEGWGWTEGEPS